MTKDDFLKLLTDEVGSYKTFLETEENQWIVKGFVDVNKNVYTISNDTKVVSKIIEILLIPKLDAFANKNGLTLELPSRQNYYPDLTFKDDEGNLFAVDLKTSYYKGSKANGLTLGSYWGYFRFRNKTMNMDYPYGEYKCHLVLGMLYRQAHVENSERNVYSVDELQVIRSVIENFVFFVQPKWKIALDRPGSGNTRNIGGVDGLDELINGTGPFAELGEDVFDDYWMNYYSKADAGRVGIGVPHYNNLASYKQYLRSQREKINKIEFDDNTSDKVARNKD